MSATDPIIVALTGELPFILIMFGLSRWAGGLIGRYGARLPLTVGPATGSWRTALRGAELPVPPQLPVGCHRR